jgi:ketohexokinase
MAKILAIGNAVMDHVVRLDHYPTEDSEGRCLGMHTQIGGNAVNNLTILSQLGHETSWCGTYTLDAWGNMLTNELNHLGIDFSLAQQVKKGQTPVSSVWLSQQQGSRTICHFRDLPELSFDHFAQIEIERFDWLHFEGRNLDNLVGMMNIAQCFLTGQPISLEVEKPRSGIEACFEKAHIIFFSKHYAQTIGFSDAKQFLTEMQKKAPHAKLFCGWGSLGGFACEQGNIFHTLANHELTVIDTLGAGDTLNAGIIDALIRGHSTAEALELGVRLAEKKIVRYGLTNLFADDNKPVLAHIKNLTAHKVTVVNHQQQSIALLRHGDQVKAFINNCPHMDVPLNKMYKIEVDPRALTLKCSVHDAFFRIEDGVCIEGPCQGKALTPAPVMIDTQGRVLLIT